MIQHCSFAFERQELRLHFKTAGKAGQRSIGAKDSMTGHDDRQGILAVGRADCANCFDGTDGSGKITVASGLAERYFP